MQRNRRRNKRKNKKSRGSNSPASEFVGNIHRSDGKIDLHALIGLDRIFGTQRVMKCKASTELTTITQTATTSTDGALTFNTTMWNDISDYLTVFDEYQIWAIKIKFIPALSSVTPYASASYLPGYLVTAIDLDDASTPTSAVQLLGYNTAIQTAPVESVTRCFRPKFSVPAYGAGAFASYCNITPDGKLGWIDNTYPSVQHYGVKYAISPGAAAQTELTQWNIVVTGYFHFRFNY
jgi:hypothetical protein